MIISLFLLAYKDLTYTQLPETLYHPHRDFRLIRVDLFVMENRWDINAAPRLTPRPGLTLLNIFVRPIMRVNRISTLGRFSARLESP